MAVGAENWIFNVFIRDWLLPNYYYRKPDLFSYIFTQNAKPSGQFENSVFEIHATLENTRLIAKFCKMSLQVHVLAFKKSVYCINVFHYLLVTKT